LDENLFYQYFLERPNMFYICIVVVVSGF